MKSSIIKKVSFTVGLLFILIGLAYVQDDISCAQYAKKAVEQFNEGKANNCDGIIGPRWSSDYQQHFNWCMTVPLAQSDSERKAREEHLRKCKGKPVLVEKCDQYATFAVSQNNENLMRTCAFTGPRWSSDYQYHYNWCVQGANVGRADVENKERQKALDEQCPTGKGDLTAYNWCYTIDKPSGSGKPISLNVHPVVINDNPLDWNSKNEGIFFVAGKWGSTTFQASHPIYRFPHWSIKAGERKILPGVALPFAVNNYYYDLGNWQLNHPDDTHPENNELVNKYGAVKGSDLLDVGKLAYLHCKSVEDNCLTAEQFATAKGMDVTIRIRKIEVLDEADGDGNAEPYLFPIFFRIDRPKAVGNDWFYSPKVSHGNLGDNWGKDWDAGDIIHVPARIGRWHTYLKRGELQIPEKTIYLGVVVLLFEEDHFPLSKDVEGIFVDISNTIRNYMKDNTIWPFLLNFPLPSENVFKTFLEDTITTRIKEETSGIPGDLDDFIGTAIFSWSWKDLKADLYQVNSRTWNESTESEDGDFTISVDVVAKPICTYTDNIAVRRGNEIFMGFYFDSFADKSFKFGNGNGEDEYLVGDWNGDSQDNIAVRRGSEIIMDFNFDSQADKSFHFGNGISGDEYLVGDWNDDGQDNIAVRKGSEIIMDFNFDSQADKSFKFGNGNSEDEYLVGDWNGDGQDNIAVRRGSEIIMDFNFDSFADKSFKFGNGNSEDEYLVGDWNGDGQDNIAVRRGSEIIMDFNFDGQADKSFKFGNGEKEDEYIVGQWYGK